MIHYKAFKMKNVSLFTSYPLNKQRLTYYEIFEQVGFRILNTGLFFLFSCVTWVELVKDARVKVLC